MSGFDSGKSRYFKLTNEGDTQIVGLNCPAVTSASIASIRCEGCQTLLPGESCEIWVSPTSIPTAEVGDTHPSPLRLAMSGLNISPFDLWVNVLTYGSFYQSGFLFSIVETVDVGVSIGGTVAAERDTVVYLPGLAWDSTPLCNDVLGLCKITRAHSPTNGTDETTSGVSGNTYLITHALTPDPLSYAAGRCSRLPSDERNHWYLPAICELGYGAHAGNVDCGTKDNPLLPNIQSNLIELGMNAFNFSTPGNYWSSTEFLLQPRAYAWYAYLSDQNNAYQDINAKFGQLGVRCVRSLNVS